MIHPAVRGAAAGRAPARIATRVIGPAKAALMAIAVGVTGAFSVMFATVVASPLLAIVAVIGLIGAGLIVLYPAIGLLLTALVIPIERLGRFGEGSGAEAMSLMRIVGSLALVGVLVQMVLRRWRLVLPVPLLLFSAFFTLAALSYLWAEDPPSTLAQVATASGNVMFLFLIVNGVRDWPLIRNMTLAWLLATVLIAIYQIYDWHVGTAEAAFESRGVLTSRFSTTWDSSSESEAIGTVRRALGTTSSAAVYGINLILTVPFFLYFAKLAPAAWARVLAGTALILVLYNIFLTNTRAVLVFAILALGACVVVGLVRVTLARILVGCCLTVAFLAAAPESIWKRILDINNYTVEKASNLRMRFEVWKAALELADERWLTGVGVGNRTVLARSIAGLVDTKLISPHNELLLVLVELGVLGLGLFIVFLVCSFLQVRRATRLYRDDPATADRYWFLIACQISILAGILFGMQVDVFHFSLKGWWLLLGFSCVLQELAIRRAPEPAAPGDRPARFIPAAEAPRR